VLNRTPDRAVAAAALAGSAGSVVAAGDGPLAEAVASADLVVNATPIGMADSSRGGSTSWPIDPQLLEEGQMVVDLVYHPPTTPWMEAASRRGARVTNGLGMLVHQAALQLAAWTGVEPPVEAMWQAVDGGTSGG